MRRLSVFRKPRDHAAATTTTSDQSNLSHFLQLQKVNYLKAVDQGQAKQWTVVMGNEAGDLDSLASAIAYAWYATNTRKSLTVPLIQSPHADLPLRAENLHTLALAGIDPGRDLLCLDDAPFLPLPSDKFALVDHNTLNPRFAHPGARVIAVIDHHADEGNHIDTADPRIVAVPTGSCASLVAPLLRDAPDTPSELATLLLAAICIDTDGLKLGGKAEQADRDAVALLLPRSTLAQQQPSSPTRSTTFATAAEPALQRLTAELQAKKSMMRLSWGEVRLVAVNDDDVPVFAAVVHCECVQQVSLRAEAVEEEVEPLVELAAKARKLLSVDCFDRF
ncbi:hypothetical protein EWM64_g7946 [Hericium alpestre]|uniref:DDH domain-containing protein n=1 Tax=Hericium alpestre TaxID=135208 RepID=A0A4Y9ZN73_9AGAM|nr:hypothetical protein EWM64_g7946 [Hericium alpestre]